ncbi:MAG TPA: hypothetical protein VJ813_21165 [Vicinamibacterales bacterium]|nr:hypothetical protein [Vicinamibacterales bacterium]
MHDRFADILNQLQSGRFRELSGARLTATVPVPEALLNELIAASLPPGAPVRGVTIHPGSDGRFSVRIVPKAALLPAITLKLAIDEQPRLPDLPVLVLRLATLSGLFGLASGAVSGMLPPGVKLEGDRIRVDLRTIAAQQGFAHVFEHVSQLLVTTEEGRLVLHLNAAIG